MINVEPAPRAHHMDPRPLPLPLLPLKYSYPFPLVSAGLSPYTLPFYTQNCHLSFHSLCGPFPTFYHLDRYLAFSFPAPTAHRDFETHDVAARSRYD